MKLEGKGETHYKRWHQENQWKIENFMFYLFLCD